MYARSTTIITEPTAVEKGIAFVRDEVLPAIQDMRGCRGLSMLVDREAGRGITTTSWESEEAMRATDEVVRPLRERAAAIMGGGAPTVAEWEIVSMHRAHHAEDGS